ncbi:hypothetical protein XENTR_v10018945 [Xenopus tropicalis]|nr:hypothetical protein XENTR_v10018945 [Xenopus tropicalis]
MTHTASESAQDSLFCSATGELGNILLSKSHNVGLSSHLSSKLPTPIEEHFSGLCFLCHVFLAWRLQPSAIVCIECIYSQALLSQMPLYLTFSGNDIITFYACC